MTQMKIGGLVLTGVGAYLVINKILNCIRGSVKDISDASKWKAYYQCKREDPIAPGYERIPTDPDSAKDGGNPPGKKGNNTSYEALGTAISGAITKAIDTLFYGREEGKIVDLKPLKGECDERDEYKCDDDIFYAISSAGYYDKHPEYEKRFMIWYEKDNVLCDENGEAIIGPEEFLNKMDLPAFFDAIRDSSDPDALYLRNDVTATDVEIQRFHSSYTKEIEKEEKDEDQ